MEQKYTKLSKIMLKMEKNFDAIFRKPKEVLEESIKENEELYKDLSRIDVVGQNGNDGLHYEYQLNKSTGEVEKVEDGTTNNS